MNHKHSILAASLGALVSLAASGGAAAQGIYRCGNTYSQQPCEEGRAVAPAGEAPSAAQQAQARANAARDAKMANDMEKARLKAEARPASAYIPASSAQPASATRTADKGAKKKKAPHRKPEHFTAVVPGSGHRKATQ